MQNRCFALGVSKPFESGGLDGLNSTGYDYLNAGLDVTSSGGRDGGSGSTGTSNISFLRIYKM